MSGQRSASTAAVVVFSKNASAGCSFQWQPSPTNRCRTPPVSAHPLESPHAELIEDCHLKDTGFFSFVDHPSEGRIRELAVPAKWFSMQPSPTRPVPRLSEHSFEVLREIGYSEARLSEFIDDGHIRTEPHDTGR